MSVVGGRLAWNSFQIYGKGGKERVFCYCQRRDRYPRSEVKGTRRSNPCTFYNAFLTSSSQES